MAAVIPYFVFNFLIMKKELTMIFGTLLFLTIINFIVFNLTIDSLLKSSLILVLFAIKFLLVAFYFMELKNANSLWKWALTTTLFLIIFILFGILIP